MVEVNQKVEYKSLLGFPENNTNEVLYLKSNDGETGFKGVSSEDIREEFGIENPSIKHYNYIKKSPKLFNDIIKQTISFPTMDANEMEIDGITYVVSASSEADEDHMAYKAFDYYTSRYWLSNYNSSNTEQWLKIYMGGQDIYPLYWTLNTGDYPCKDFKIQGSNDDELWEDLVVDKVYNSAGNNLTYYSNIKNKSFKYFRLLMTSQWNDELLSVQDWDFKGFIETYEYILEANVNEDNPIIYVDDNGDEHIINYLNPLVVHPKSYKNILPKMNSLSEQGWTLSANKMNGYEYAYPYYMTNSAIVPGYECNSGLSELDMSKVTFESETEFTPEILKIKCRTSVLNGYTTQVYKFNVRNGDGDVVGFDLNAEGQISGGEWMKFYMNLSQPTTSLTIEAYDAHNHYTRTDSEGNVTTLENQHSFGTGCEILVADDNGTIYDDYCMTYVFLDYSNEELIEIRNKFTISQVSPETPKENDVWLSVLDKNRVYKFNGSEWVLTSYIPLADITFESCDKAYVFNYPCVTNWYEQNNLQWQSHPITNDGILPVSPIVQNIKNKNMDVILVGEDDEGNTIYTTNFRIYSQTFYNVASLVQDDYWRRVYYRPKVLEQDLGIKLNYQNLIHTFNFDTSLTNKRIIIRIY